LPELTTRYFAEFAWGVVEDPRLNPALSLLDRVEFLRIHRDEMVKSLEVVEIVETEKIAVALVRYSIGLSVYRDRVWMRRVDGRWFASVAYFSEYAEDPFGDGKPDEAKALIKRVEAWEKASAEKWW
jgi:hypothetical protein